MRRALIVVSLAALAFLSVDMILRIISITTSHPAPLLLRSSVWENAVYALAETVNVLVPAPAIVALVHAAQHRRWVRITPLLSALALATYSPLLTTVAEGLGLLRWTSSDTQSYYLLFWIGYSCRALPPLVTLAYARYGFASPRPPDLEDVEVSRLRTSYPPSP